MNNNVRWIAVVVALLLAGGAAIVAYNAGVAHGLAQSGKFVVGPGGWGPHPWGWGFFPLAPLFFIFLFFFVLRGIFWRGAWHRHGYGCGYRGLDEWHRQAHETMQQKQG